MSISANFPNVRPAFLADFAESQTLDPRITFSRSTTAVYYDNHSATLAEQNLLTYSQDYTQSAWVQSGLTGVTASATTAPDGTNTGQLVTPNGNSGVHGLTQTQSASTVGKTVSVYAKAGTNNYIQILFGGDANPWANFDISAGAVGTTGTTTTASVVSVGNGWYRCVLTTTSTTATDFRIYLVTSSTSVRGETNTLTSTIYLWGSQTETRGAVTAYNATTTSAITNYIPTLQTAPINAPRFDFNPVTGESLGLLIEQSSTNLLTYSQDFTNGVWPKVGSSITASAGIAPDGTQTMQLLVEDTSTGSHYLNRSGATSSVANCFSVYAKSAGRTQIALQLGGGVAYFDLNAGTVLSGTGATITAVGNGVYRCSITGTPANGNSLIYLASSGTVSYTGNGYSGVYIWGAQDELLSFPTSYIATTSSQVTRAADVASMTGTNFSSWFNQSQGTFYAEAISPTSVVNDGSGVAKGILSANDNTNNNVIELAYQGTKYFVNTNNSTVILSASIGTLTANTLFKTACVYSNSYFVQARDGTVGTAVTTGLTPIVSQLNIGRGLPANGFWTGWIKKAAFYPQAITTSAQLQALTGS